MVDDVESASYFRAGNFGVGPFLLFDFGGAFSDIFCRSERREFSLVLALAQCNLTQIELT